MQTNRSLVEGRRTVHMNIIKVIGNGNRSKAVISKPFCPEDLRFFLGEHFKIRKE